LSEHATTSLAATAAPLTTPATVQPAAPLTSPAGSAVVAVEVLDARGGREPDLRILAGGVTHELGACALYVGAHPRTVPVAVLGTEDVRRRLAGATVLEVDTSGEETVLELLLEDGCTALLYGCRA
jgi:hypothetical protein